MGFRTAIAAAGLVAAGLAMAAAGCSTADDGVASLGGEPSSPEARVESQADGARAMAECLRAADIPAELVLWDDKGLQQVTLATEETRAMSFDGKNAHVIDYSKEAKELDRPGFEVEVARLEAMIRAHDPAIDLGVGPSLAPGVESEGPPGDPEPYLIIGDQDLSDKLIACLDSIEFTPAEAFIDPAEEIAYKDHIIEATMPWVKCARERGYPNLSDPQPATADGYDTIPTAVLPADITPDQLRILLEECPTFDPEKQAAVDAAVEALGPDASDEDLEKAYGAYDWNAISIGFDQPGFDGTRQSDNISPEDHPNILALLEVIDAPRASYYGDGAALDAG
jgi:hypothetical protein